jgi:hypothetical protein
MGIPHAALPLTTSLTKQPKDQMIAHGKLDCISHLQDGE